MDDPNSPGSVSPWALKHSQELGFPSPGRWVVELLTDPWSVWCWGFEPVRKTLLFRYPQVEFRFRVGGMFERLPPLEEMGFDVSLFFSMVQEVTGMPISLDFRRAERPESTYPASIAFFAAHLADPGRSTTFLRRMRETAFLDAQNVSDRRIQEEVARKSGIDLELFREALESGEAEREFSESLAFCESRGLRAYPTLILRTHEKEVRAEGYHSLPALLTLLGTLAGRTLVPRPPPALEDLFREGDRVATKEVATVLSVSLERGVRILEEEERSGRVVRESHPGGDVWTWTNRG